jgi:hypothetical protein
MLDLEAIFGGDAVAVAEPAAVQVATDATWCERIGHRGGQTWRVLQRDGVEVFPFGEWLGTPKVAGGCICGSRETVDVAIHNGRSTRRDCARCGRFLAFTVWHGEPAS